MIDTVDANTFEEVNMKSFISPQLLLVAAIAFFLSSPVSVRAAEPDTEVNDDDVHVVEEGGTEDDFEEYYEDTVEDPLFEEGAEVYVKGGLAQAFDSSKFLLLSFIIIKMPL